MTFLNRHRLKTHSQTKHFLRFYLKTHFFRQNHWTKRNQLTQQKRKALIDCYLALLGRKIPKQDIQSQKSQRQTVPWTLLCLGEH